MRSGSSNAAGMRDLDVVPERLEQPRRALRGRDAVGVHRLRRCSGIVVMSPMRSVPGSAPTSSRYGRAAAGATNGSPGSGPAATSSSAARRAPSRVTANCTRSGRATAHRCAGTDRDAAPRRLQPDEPAAARRDPDRSAAVARVRRRHHPARDRGRRPAARPARRAVGVPRVAGRSVRRPARSSA